MAVCGVAVLLCGRSSSVLGETAPDRRCPPGAIDVLPTSAIQTAVDQAPAGSVFCIKAGVHRARSTTPKQGQAFFGEPESVLNGANVVSTFQRVNSQWIAGNLQQRGVRRGACKGGTHACELPIGFFIDGQPLAQVESKTAVAPGRFHYDPARQEILFADDPTGKLVEATAARFACHGLANGVRISGLTIEKYFNPAQEGAVQGALGTGWRVEKSEFRLNSGAGVTVGTDGAIVDCNVHHNGQLGVGATGSNILIEGNHIWNNNIYGFDASWEAGGAKVSFGKNVTFRGNNAHHNAGPGLWCDLNCHDTLFENNIVEYNGEAGIFFEISDTAMSSVRWGFGA
jgi:hypothetical protein